MAHIGVIRHPADRSKFTCEFVSKTGSSKNFIYARRFDKASSAIAFAEAITRRDNLEVNIPSGIVQELEFEN